MSPQAPSAVTMPGKMKSVELDCDGNSEIRIQVLHQDYKLVFILGIGFSYNIK